jgi:hypothetical protein
MMVHSSSQVSIHLYILTSPGHHTLLERLAVESPYHSGRQMQVEGPVRVESMPEGYTRVALTLKFGTDLSSEARIDEICEYSWHIVRQFIDRVGVGMAWRLNIDNCQIIAWDELGRSPHCALSGIRGRRVRQEKVEKRSNC